jgi:hypothetical protein
MNKEVTSTTEPVTVGQRFLRPRAAAKAYLGRHAASNRRGRKSARARRTRTGAISQRMAASVLRLPEVFRRFRHGTGPLPDVTTDRAARARE